MASSSTTAGVHETGDQRAVIDLSRGAERPVGDDAQTNGPEPARHAVMLQEGLDLEKRETRARAELYARDGHLAEPEPRVGHADDDGVLHGRVACDQVLEER